MRAGPFQTLSALLFASAILSAPLAAQNATPPTNSGDDATTTPASPSNISPLRHIGGGVTPPKVVYQVSPQFSEQARAAKFSGVVLVNIIVDAHGLPQNVHVLRGVGMGLDESAMEAVTQYRFEPAMLGDKPVPVELNVEVNFQIFKDPKILHSVPLELTDTARQNKASGTILVAFIVDTEGNPQNVHVLHGVGMGMDFEAVKAVHQYKFEPFVENGQPVAKPTTLQLKFDAK